MLLNFAKLCRANQRVTVFFRKSRWNKDFKIDFLYHAIHSVRVNALHNLNSICGQSTLLAEAKHIDACACSDGGKENFKRGGRASCRRLICWDREIAKVRINA